LLSVAGAGGEVGDSKGRLVGGLVGTVLIVEAIEWGGATLTSHLLQVSGQIVS
jgi:hypothetical protein